MKKIILPPGAKYRDPPHVARLKEVGKWRLPKEGSSAWVDMRLRNAAAMRDPRYKKALKEVSRISESTGIVIQKNGAGLPADSGLREFITDYNKRTAHFGLHYLPTSFNIFQSFTEYLPKYGLFVPFPEKNFISSISGLLDHISTLADPETIAPELAEGVIYNYSFIESPGEWIFGEGENLFTVSSVAMIRHQHEVTLMCLAGVKEDLNNANEEIAAWKDSLIKDPDKPDLESDPSLVQEAVALDAGRIFRRVYFAIRYDLERKSIQVRYVFQDSGNMWAVKTDDPISLENFEKIADQDVVRKHADSVAEYEDFFVFSIKMFHLPEYFKCNAKHVLEDRSITELQELSGAKGRKFIDHALKNFVVYDRKVLTLRPLTEDLDSVVLPSFELKVEVEGYWERLEFGAYGVGPDGERILGRTWVHRTLSKRQSRIGGGSLIANRQSLPIIGGAEEGSIYVLRNASHQIDIFKIGLTRRDVQTRASELSRGTGVPDRFLTVQSWWVPDVVYAERRIHELLSEYRLTGRREFFQAGYQTIRAAVDLVVGEMAGRALS